MKFSTIDLCPELLTSIKELGFETPTPVQEEVIPFLLKNTTDLVALAQTGTGKTGAYGIPILEKIDRNNPKTQALILCPTRELCMQIAQDLKCFSNRIPAIKILPVYGGTDIQTQLPILAHGVQIVVATPGRMHDILQRRKANFSAVKHVVLDEADEMLNMGFEEDLKGILSNVPANAQTLLFSATMPREVALIASNYMKTPHEITIGSRNATTDLVRHEVMIIHAKDRYQILRRLVDINVNIYGIIFCRTRMETQLVADRLSNDGYTAEALHGDMLQEERDTVMKKFRAHRLQLLIATDVAARGIDVNEITHVIHYAIPDDYNTYAHRSGRTGRAGKTGISIVLIHMREQFKLERIEKSLGGKFEQKTLPIGSEITRIRLLNLAERIRDYKVDQELLENNIELMCSVLNDLSKKEIIQRIALMEQHKALQYYKDMPDLSTEPEKSRTKLTPSEHKSGKDARAAHVPRKMTLGMIELVINIGKFNELTPLRLKELLNSVPGRHIELGRINIVEKQSYFEVPYTEYNDIINHFSKNPTLFAGRKLNVVTAGNAKPFAPPSRNPKRKGFYDKKKRPPKHK